MSLESRHEPAPGVTIPKLNLDTDLQATLELRVYAPDLLGLRVCEIERTVRSGAEPQKGEADLKAQMRGEVLVRRAVDGRLGDIAYPRNSTAEARRTWAYLLESLTVAERDESAWECEETDATGRYVARYTRVTPIGKTPADITRRKLRYLTISAGGALADGATAEVDAETHFRIDPWPVRIEGRQALTIHLGAQKHRIESREEFRVERLGVELAEIVPPEVDWRARADHALLAAERDRAGPARVEKLADLLHRLQQMGQNDTETAYKAAHELANVIRDSDAAARAALTRFADAPMAISASLGAADTEASREALRTVLADITRPRDDRRQALFALIQTTNPSETLVETLRTVRSEEPELADSALLVIGAVGGEIPEDRTAQRDRIEAELLEELERARTVQQASTALEALGNFGPRAIPKRALAFSYHAIAALRASAIRAMGRIPRKEARRAIERILERDPEASVRATAIDTLWMRKSLGLDEKLSDAVARVVREDPDQEVRERARRILDRVEGS